jgi:hypothetical protein
LIPFPDKKYQIIYADPPWPIKLISRKVRPKQLDMPYKIMTYDDIRKLPVKTREMEPEERQKELTLDGNGGNQGEKLREEMEAINPLTGKKVMFCNRTTGQAHIH